MTSRRVITHEVSIKDEPLARVHLVATLVDAEYLLPMRNFFDGKSIQPDERVSAVSDDDGMIAVELVRNDVMSLDSRYLIETWIEREDGTRTPRRAVVIYLADGSGDADLHDLTPATEHTGPTPVTPTVPTTMHIWAQATADAPTSIPQDAIESMSLMASVTLAQNGFIVFAQREEVDDLTTLVTGGINFLGAVYPKGDMPFVDSGQDFEYWISALEQRGPQTVIYSWTR